MARCSVISPQGIPLSRQKNRSRSTAPPASARVWLLLVLPMAGLIGLSLLLVAGAVYWMGQQQNAQALELARTHVERGIANERERVVTEQRGLVLWDEGVSNTAIAFNADWFVPNVAAILQHEFKHDWVFLLDERNQPVVALDHGTRARPEAFLALHSRVAPLLQRLRQQPVNQPGAVSGLLLFQEQASIIAISKMVPDKGGVSVPATGAYLVVSVVTLDERLLRRIANDHLISKLAWHSAAAQDQAGDTTPDAEPAADAAPADAHSAASASHAAGGTQPTLSIVGLGGGMIGALTWDQPQPGAELTRRLLPMLGFAGLAVGLLAALVVLAFRRSSRALSRSQSEIDRLVQSDKLTGLPNRAHMAQQLDHALDQIVAGRGAAGVLLLDIDGFRDINAKLGHAGADQLLIAFASQLKELARPEDVVARLEGDSFVIIQTSAVQPAGAEALARRLMQIGDQPFGDGGADIRVRLSVGISVAPVDGLNRDELLGRAELALQQARAEGGNCYRFYQPGLDANVRLRRDLGEALRAAIGTDEIELAFQPMFEGARVIGAEALVRWNHPTRGLIPPPQFVPIAEDLGLVRQLTEQILNLACKTARTWPDLFVSVNLSPEHFRDPKLERMVWRALETSGLPARCLELEVTETVLLRATDATMATLKALRRLGVRISLDDFGTGYSSLSYLNRFKFDKLKIDRVFVMDLETNPLSRALIRSIVGLAKSLKMAVIAEGVETREQLAILRAEGVPAFQGFLFCKPLTADQFKVLIDQDKLPDRLSA